MPSAVLRHSGGFFPLSGGALLPAPAVLQRSRKSGVVSVLVELVKMHNNRTGPATLSQTTPCFVIQPRPPCTHADIGANAVLRHSASCRQLLTKETAPSHGHVLCLFDGRHHSWIQCVFSTIRNSDSRRAAVTGQNPVSAARTPQMRIRGGKQGRASI